MLKVFLKAVIMFTMSSFKECITRRLFTGTFFTICRKLSTVKILTFWNLKKQAAPNYYAYDLFWYKRI